MSTIVVLVGGAPADRAVVDRIPSPDLVIAADSGLAQADALGLSVDEVVGDMDSVDPELLEAARAAGARIMTHPVAKDATDMDLAMQRARALGAARIVVLGGGGGRLDHLLGNALLLASPDHAGTEVEWWAAGARVLVVRHGATLHGKPGDLVSLLAVGGPARGVRTEGLRWRLDGDDLAAGSSRGISNELTGEEAKVSVSGGTLLLIHGYA